MGNIYMLTDSVILTRIGQRVKKIRLKQNISQQALAQNAGVSLSSVIRMEEGKIKSFDTFVRILRTLGKLEIFASLIDEEPISPNEYYRLVNEAKTKTRKRAAKRPATKPQEVSAW